MVTHIALSLAKSFAIEALATVGSAAARPSNADAAAARVAMSASLNWMASKRRRALPNCSRSSA